jgi:hypothetical protein
MELFVKVSIKVFNHSILMASIISTDITGVALCNMLDKLNIKNVYKKKS